MTKNTDWMRDGACIDEDPELFFAEELQGEARTLRIGAARAICAGCTVMWECRAWAIESGQRSGMWGGLSQRELETLRRREANRITRNDPIVDDDAVDLLVAGKRVPGASRLDVAHAAVRLAKSGLSLAEVGRRLGVDGTTVRIWRQRADAGQPLINQAWLERQRKYAETALAEVS